MEKIKFSLSAYVFLAAGLLWLLSLTFLPAGELAPWITAKVLYGAGTLLFIFNK